MESLGYPLSDSFQATIDNIGVRGKIRLLKVYRKAQKYVDLLVDVQGHQMLSLGIFNGDPHPGNLLVLTDGKLGLIDFGQTKRISEEERLGVARVVAAIGDHSSDRLIADSMRQLGFCTKFNKDNVLAQYATLFFDSDIDGQLMGCATPQMYFSRLNKMDPLINVPDVASKLTSFLAYEDSPYTFIHSPACCFAQNSFCGQILVHYPWNGHYPWSAGPDIFAMERTGEDCYVWEIVGDTKIVVCII